MKLAALGPRFWFGSAAALAGLTFSCKFTAVLIPPLLGLVWWVDLWRGGQPPIRAFARAARGMVAFTALMLLADWAVTGFAVLPLSPRTGAGHPSLESRLARWPRLVVLVDRAAETPLPQDWVGFLTQMHHQGSGGPSYLFGRTRMTGWRYYYLVAMAVKVPLGVWLILAVRAASTRRPCNDDGMLTLIVAAFLLATALGSSRNYGLRYVLPMAPLAIAWASRLAETPGWPRRVAWLALLGQALAVGSVHPDELTYFNVIAGGRIGGRHVLADSNLDWGQGLRALARLQNERTEFRDLTIFYFGEIDPHFYGVQGTCHTVDALQPRRDLPPRFEAATAYVAVSASLQWGPWGPPGYFKGLDGVRPVAYTRDTTIAIYRSEDIFKSNPSRDRARERAGPRGRRPSRRSGGRGRRGRGWNRSHRREGSR